MKLRALTAIGSVLMLPAALTAQPAAVPKTNPMKVYAHYMPWFETPATLGPNNWGYHWKFNNRNPNIVDGNGRRQIASHYYPKIGPYASSDPDVIENHLLLMKVSGIDGVMIDWYGVQGTNGDVGSLLNNSNALISKVDDFGLKFSVVMEDRFSTVSSSNLTPDINKAKANMAYLRNNYFNNPSYIRQNAGADPLVGVFGPIRFQTESQWTQILAEAGEPVDFNTLWYEKNDAGVNADGEYAWIYEDENLDDHMAHQSNFLNVRAPTLGTAGAMAYPGFNDYYEEGGVGNVVPFNIPHNNGQTLDALLDQVQAVANQSPGRIDFLQLGTWNDFGEGTMLEPTLETGFSYLERIQQFTGVSYGVSELQLVHDLFEARKNFAGNALKQSMLNQVSSYINQLDFNSARATLNALSQPSWNLSTGGNWHTPGNWSGSVPNGIGAAAVFGPAIAAAGTVFADTAVTVGTITFDNTNTYVLGGAGTLTLQVSGGSAAVNVLRGTHKINLPLIIASDTTLNVASGATLKMSDPVTVNAGKIVTQTGSGTVLLESTLKVLSGGSFELMSGGSAMAHRINSVSLDGSAILDLNDNDLVTSTAKARVEALVKNARNDGSWDQPGITSTTARNDASQIMTLGVMSGAEYNSVGGKGTFAGRPYASADALVKYTCNGDTNFNGTVTLDDYERMDAGFDGHLAGWVNGDFDYSGSVTFEDFVLIDIAFNTQSGTLGNAIEYLRSDNLISGGLDAPAMRKMAEHFRAFGDPYADAFMSVVPEPSSLVSVLVAAAGTTMTRRRFCC